MDPVARVFQGFTAYQLSAALKGAIELDLFSAIAEGNATAEALATRCQASTRGVRILCDYLAAVGFLHKTDGRYTLDPESGPLLDRRSPLYVGSAIRFLASPVVMQSFADVAGAVRKGGTVVDAGGATAPEHPMWVDFARAMAPLPGFVAQLLANLLDADAGRPWHVLDIAAGHGLFGITLAARNPRASVVALDWANVLTVAEENARAAGVADRFRTLPGSAFTVDYGRDYDLVLLTNFLHHFDEEACVAVLRKVHAALRPGGRAVTVEMISDENRVTPPEAATFALVMLAGTPGGDAYPFSEFERMFHRAGFARSELHPLPPGFLRAVISYRD
ncbi:MAG: methyltransferase domain-containing protein [Deltaproteobacteria bacterium]|nr:MAG: methyltransferase domain-containing protein [Deltaproteobacteria bacterium]